MRALILFLLLTSISLLLIAMFIFGCERDYSTNVPEAEAFTLK
jgi:hypothetical protein